MLTCPECQSTNIAHYAIKIGYTAIPAGTYRFCGCRQCDYWWESVSTSETTIDGDHWQITAHGQGTFGTPEEQAATRLPLDEWERGE